MLPIINFWSGNSSPQPRQHKEFLKSASTHIQIFRFLLCCHAQDKHQIAFQFLVYRRFPNMLPTVNLLSAASKPHACTTQRSLSTCCLSHHNVSFLGASMHHINFKRLLSFWYVTSFQTCLQASICCVDVPSSQHRQEKQILNCATKHIRMFFSCAVLPGTT